MDTISIDNTSLLGPFAGFKGGNTMFARVMSAKMNPGDAGEAARDWGQSMERFKSAGLLKAFMLVNRDTGEYLSITLWPDEATQEANNSGKDHTSGRDSMAKKYFGKTPIRSVFDVVAVSGAD